jgi:hypothetical protein
MLAIAIIRISILAHDSVIQANNGREVDGDACLYRLACEMDDRLRQTGKHKRIVRLPDLQIDAGILWLCCRRSN